MVCPLFHEKPSFWGRIWKLHRMKASDNDGHEITIKDIGAPCAVHTNKSNLGIKRPSPSSAQGAPMSFDMKSSCHCRVVALRQRMMIYLPLKPIQIHYNTTTNQNCSEEEWGNATVAGEVEQGVENGIAIVNSLLAAPPFFHE